MGFFSLFEQHVHTETACKKPSKRPIIVKSGIKAVLKRIDKFYKKNGFENIYCNENYGEIYGEVYPYEFSCHLIADGAKTIVHVMVYNSEGRRKMKMFNQFMTDLREELKDITDVA